MSHDTVDLPKYWRDANISSIFTEGVKHLPENDRPVSLTSVTSKILEHIICRHMLKHLEKNKILTNLNHGSCITNSHLTEDVTLSGRSFMWQRNSIGSSTLPWGTPGSTVVSLLDFSKAFDTVPHSKLLHKLHQYGIKGKIHKWLTNFLTARSMRTIVEGEKSNETTVDPGVPVDLGMGCLELLEGCDYQKSRIYSIFC
jgi:hypothetical protein